MTGEDLYKIWAPDSTWSPWVKPVLFAHALPSMISGDYSDNFNDYDVSWAPTANGVAAIVIDLPGDRSVAMGLSLAAVGYRPVPLFNAVPRFMTETSFVEPASDIETSQSASDVETYNISGAVKPLTRGDMAGRVSPLPPANWVTVPSSGPKVAVDMSPILSLLAKGAERLSSMGLAPEAPPAFLLDSRRRAESSVLRPGDFDNRSISLPTDFPSANFLLASGIARVIFVTERLGAPQQDLSHTLRRWQDAKIEISCWAPGTESPQRAVIPRPPWFRHMWYGLLARMGLRKNPLGGYGGFLPMPSAG